LLGGLRISNALLVGQVALSLLLLSSGGLFLMSAMAATTADPGFRLDGGVLMEVDPGLAGYDESRGRQLHLTLADRLRSIPGVEAVTIGSQFAFTSMGDSRLVAPAGVADDQSRSVDAVFSAVGRDYARVLGLPMLGGRDFSEAELVPNSSAPVVIIDSELAQRLWPGESALGRQIQFLDAEGSEVRQPMLVVGLVPAVKHSLSNPQPFPHVYVPLGQYYESAVTLQVRSRESAQAMLTTVAGVVRSLDERVPILRLETWRDHLNASVDIWLYRAGARAFTAFGAIALLLVVVGVYGVKSYIVSRRMREFGIRLAIGAHPRTLLWQVLREGGRSATVGIGIGITLALGVGRLLQGFLFGVNGVEPVVLVITPLILLASSLLASVVPARRATRVDLATVLRDS
jgi:predicted permease